MTAVRRREDGGGGEGGGGEGGRVRGKGTRNKATGTGGAWSGKAAADGRRSMERRRHWGRDPDVRPPRAQRAGAPPGRGPSPPHSGRAHKRVATANRGWTTRGGRGGVRRRITDRKRNSARPRTARNRPALLAGAGPLGRHGVATTRVSRIRAACEAQDQEGLSQMGPTRIKYASKVPKSGTRDLANSTMNFMPMYAFRSVVRFVLQRILLLFDSDGRRPPSCLACPPSPGRRPPTSLLPRLPPLPPPLP